MRLSRIVAAAALLASGIAAVDKKMSYPHARRSDQADVLHGVRVADPYRWLEDPDSPETRAWVAAENKLTGDYLAAIPAKKKIEKRLTELWNFERYGSFFKAGGRYFYSRNDGLQNQSVIFTAPSL